MTVRVRDQQGRIEAAVAIYHRLLSESLPLSEHAGRQLLDALGPDGCYDPALRTR